jgi:hypothetical protein
MKKCSMCGLFKTESHFYPASANTGGLQSRCKECKDSLGKYVPKDRTGEVHANLIGGPKGTYSPEKFVGRVGGDDHMKVKSLRFGERIEQYVGDKLRSME